LVQEMRDFQAVGGKSIVDLTCRNMGGDVRALKRISETTGVNIVAACGWYRESYMEPAIYHRPTNELAEELIHDIEHGLDGTDIRPGIIGEIGTEYNHPHFSAKEERCLRAIAKAQRRSGLAITTHMPMAIGFELLDILAEYDVPPERVIIGHCETKRYLDYHVALIKRGAYLEFDNMVYDGPQYVPELVAYVAELVRQGFADHILLSHDICWRTRLKHFGGNGLDYLGVHFIPMLKDAGVDDEAIHTMTVENPRRVLAIG
jgi:predicted metal-dependent phosphotriesterase family hydrolase